MHKSWYDQKTKELNAHILGMKAIRKLSALEKRIELMNWTIGMADHLSDKKHPAYPEFKKAELLSKELFGIAVARMKKLGNDWVNSARPLTDVEIEHNVIVVGARSRRIYSNFSFELHLIPKEPDPSGQTLKYRCTNP